VIPVHIDKERDDIMGLPVRQNLSTCTPVVSISGPWLYGRDHQRHCIVLYFQPYLSSKKYWVFVSLNGFYEILNISGSLVQAGALRDFEETKIAAVILKKEINGIKNIYIWYQWLSLFNEK
jgi:hypothetical protein